VSDLDLTEAVDAAARAHMAAQYARRGVDWDDLPALDKHAFREFVTPLVSAAAPFIAEQAQGLTVVCAESCAGQSWTGVDQVDGPDKVWRCDTCGRIVSQNVSNPS
jgi:hypothetical protein